jgi:hypothetical protein
VISLSATDDDGATQPLGHGNFSFKGVMVDKQMVIEFHHMVAELFFVDKDFGCGDSSHII